MPTPVKHTIKYRGEVLEDLGVESINYAIDDGETVSFERDAWEGVNIEQAVIIHALPNGRESWMSGPLPQDPDWESEITVYADE